MAENQYYKLVLRQLSTRLEEVVSQFCFEHGASGITEELEFDQSDDAFNVKTLEGESHDISVFFESPPSEDFFVQLNSRFPGLSVDLVTEQNKDWLEEWKKGFKSFELCQNCWVVPSWEEPPKNTQFIIRIDPGMAFGTGTHETTQLVAQILNERSAHESLVDVGTGTGIIAILAALKGYKNIWATEIDDLARDVARENFKLNSVEVELPDYQLHRLDEAFDVVVANIIDGVLLDIQEDLWRLTKPGGHIILSGILSERVNRFEKSFIGFSEGLVKEKKTLGEWNAYLIEKPHA